MQMISAATLTTRASRRRRRQADYAARYILDMRHDVSNARDAAHGAAASQPRASAAAPAPTESRARHDVDMSIYFMPPTII